jgi:hypothetical protein
MILYKQLQQRSKCTTPRVVRQINGFYFGWMQLLVVLYNYTQFWQLTITDCLRLAPFLAGPQASSFLLRWMKNSCSHLELPWTTSVSRKHTNSILTSPLTSSELWVWVWVWVMLRPTVSRPVCLEVKHQTVAYDQIFITVRQLRVCWCGALSLTRAGGLSFTIAAGLRRLSHSRVRVPWDSRSYFTVSDSRLPFSSPPTTRRATVEVSDPPSSSGLILGYNC